MDTPYMDMLDRVDGAPNAEPAEEARPMSDVERRALIRRMKMFLEFQVQCFDGLLAKMNSLDHAYLFADSEQEIGHLMTTAQMLAEGAHARWPQRSMLLQQSNVVRLDRMRGL